MRSPAWNPPPFEFGKIRSSNKSHTFLQKMFPQVWESFWTSAEACKTRFQRLALLLWHF